MDEALHIYFESIVGLFGLFFIVIQQALCIT